MEKTRQVRWLYFVLLYVLVICFSVTAYGKDNGKRGPVLTLHGNVDAGYLVAHDALKKVPVKQAKGAGTIVDTVMAVPVYRGNLDPRSMLNSKTTSVKPGGGFSLSLEKDSDWLLILMNSAAAGPDRFVAQIAFRASDPNNTLLLLPVSTAGISSLNIGKVNAAGGIAVAQHRLKPADFSLTPEQFAALARNDERFANVLNLVMNYDTVSGVYYILRPDFFWPGNYAEILGAFATPVQYAYKSYNFQLDSNSTELTIDQVCGASKTLVELYPPAGALLDAQNPQKPADDTIPAVYRTYNDTKPISNDNAVCSIAADGAVEVTEPANGDFFASNRYGNISYTFGIDLLTDPVPPGFWTYKVGGADKAQFDFSSPVFAPRTPEEKVNGIAPVIKVNTDTSGRITSVEVKWYVINTTTVPYTYDEIIDLSTLQYLIGSAGIFFDNSFTGPRRYESVNFDPATQTSVSPANAWYYGYAGTPGEQAESIGVFYSSAGLGYFFTFERFVYSAGDPSFILPVPARYTAYVDPIVPSPTCIKPENLSMVTRGQQYNACYSSVTHTGLDFGFDWPAPPASPLFREIVAPCDGIVTSISRNYFVNGYDVGIQCNRTWGTYLAFEPCNPDAAILDMQKTEIGLAVYVNQVVRQGQRIGRLVVSEATPGCFGPHVHWGVGQTDAMMTWTDVCPRDHSTVEAQTQLDDLYAHLCGPSGQLLPACLPPPPPECHPLP